MTDLKRIAAKMIEDKLGYTRAEAEDLADDFVRDDFPKNGIRTAGQAIAYMDQVIARVLAAKA